MSNNDIKPGDTIPLDLDGTTRTTIQTNRAGNRATMPIPVRSLQETNRETAIWNIVYITTGHIAGLSIAIALFLKSYLDKIVEHPEVYLTILAGISSLYVISCVLMIVFASFTGKKSPEESYLVFGVATLAGYGIYHGLLKPIYGRVLRALRNFRKRYRVFRSF